MLNDLEIPDSSEVDEWITPFIFKINGHFYEIAITGIVRELTPCEIERLPTKRAEK